jgi:hypothetical protein
MRYYLLAALVYLSLIYSTALHIIGPEATMEWRLEYFTRPHELMRIYPDIGSVPALDSAHIAPWKITSFWGDSGYYLLQADDLSQSIAPYRYRFLPTLIVGSLSRLTDIPVVGWFLLVNVLAVLSAALLFTWFLCRDVGHSPPVALLGGVLLVTMVANVRTLPYPMVDPVSMLWVALVFIAVARRNPMLFIIAAVCGVATKETLIFAAPMWLVETWPERRYLRNGVIALAPVAAFVAIRLALGGAALEVNYGYDVAAGQLPEYWQRLTTAYGIADTAVKVFLGFSWLWLGLVNVGKIPLLRRHWFVAALVILAAVLLSSHIARVIGVCYPVVIAGVLRFIENPSTSTP